MMKQKCLIVNADDLGLCAEVNEGILDLVREGAVTAVSLFVTPSFQVDLRPFLETNVSIALHFNLTFGKPCTKAATISSLADASGNFINDIPRLIAEFDEKQVEKEFRAQLKQFQKLTGRNPSQLNTHKHIHAQDETLCAMLVEMGKELGVPVRAINSKMRNLCRLCGVYTTENFIGEVVPAPYWTIERLSELLKEALEGRTELMCHPGKNMKKDIKTSYLFERETEWRTLMSPETKKLLKDFCLCNFEQAFRR